MNQFDSQRYIKKCPICGNILETDDIDYNFEGNQNESSTCNHCHISFEFYIRYGHLWKYTKTQLIEDKQWGWVCDEQTTQEVIVWKGNKK